MIKVALIGTGRIAMANHLPGINRCPDARVTTLCDTNLAALEDASRASGIRDTWTDPLALLRKADVDAVIIATPNRVHHDIALAAVASGRHVLCEKPLAMSGAEARAMAEAADRAGVRHMTAFTYRFVPAMRYMKRLVDEGFVGRPWHFRAQRFQDWGRRHLGWRQLAAEAGSGETGDMLSHRIDYAHVLVGPVAEVMARTRRVWDTRIDPNGREHPSDLEDWVGCLAEFVSGATGVLESSKIATGHGEGSHSRDYCEVNGEAGTLIYELERPHQLLAAQRGGRLAPVAVPAGFLTRAGRAIDAGVDPLQAFRYEQNEEFIEAIRDGRPAEPSFHDGARVQAVMDAIHASAASGRVEAVQHGR